MFRRSYLPVVAVILLGATSVSWAQAGSTVTPTAHRYTTEMQLADENLLVQVSGNGSSRYRQPPRKVEPRKRIKKGKRPATGQTVRDPNTGWDLHLDGSKPAMIVGKYPKKHIWLRGESKTKPQK